MCPYPSTWNDRINKWTGFCLNLLCYLLSFLLKLLDDTLVNTTELINQVSGGIVDLPRIYVTNDYKIYVV